MHISSGPDGSSSTQPVVSHQNNCFWKVSPSWLVCGPISIPWHCQWPANFLVRGLSRLVQSCHCPPAPWLRLVAPPRQCPASAKPAGDGRLRWHGKSSIFFARIARVNRLWGNSPCPIPSLRFPGRARPTILSSYFYQHARILNSPLQPAVRPRPPRTAKPRSLHSHTVILSITCAPLRCTCVHGNKSPTSRPSPPPTRPPRSGLDSSGSTK